MKRQEKTRIEKARREAEAKQVRAQALLRYARLKQGKPIRCTANGARENARRLEGIDRDTKPKVIFKSLDDAKAFAEIVYALDGVLQTAYECPVSQHGHAHLTSSEQG